MITLPIFILNDLKCEKIFGSGVNPNSEYKKGTAYLPLVNS